MTGAVAKHMSIGRRRSGRGGGGHSIASLVSGRLLVAACLQLIAAPGTSGIRDEGLRDEFGDDVTRCCCLGDTPDQCRLLRGKQLAKSAMPTKKGPVCPNDLGYRQWTRFDFESLPAACADPDAEAEAGVKITVKAYWMRHGWSCANALQAQSKPPMKDKLPFAASRYEAYHHGFYNDPGLTNAAVVRAFVLGRAIRARMSGQTGQRLPLVFSSTMVRAMETAMWNFPESEVRPIPYIAEKGSGPANKPIPWEDQKELKLTRAPNTEQMVSHIVFDVNTEEHEDRRSGKKSDYDEFLRYFPRILKTLLADEQLEAGAEVPVVIVSHSHYMKHYLQCGESLDRIPRNNEVWVQTYNVDLGSYDAALDPVGCEELFDSTESNLFPLQPEILCEVDIERCSSEGSNFRPLAWLKHDEEACNLARNKNIVERDLHNKEPYARFIQGFGGIMEAADNL